MGKTQSKGDFLTSPESKSKPSFVHTQRSGSQITIRARIDFNDLENNNHKYDVDDKAHNHNRENKDTTEGIGEDYEELEIIFKGKSLENPEQVPATANPFFENIATPLKMPVDTPPKEDKMVPKSLGRGGSGDHMADGDDDTLQKSGETDQLQEEVQQRSRTKVLKLKGQGDTKSSTGTTGTHQLIPIIQCESDTHTTPFILNKASRLPLPVYVPPRQGQKCIRTPHPTPAMSYVSSPTSPEEEQEKLSSPEPGPEPLISFSGSTDPCPEPTRSKNKKLVVKGLKRFIESHRKPSKGSHPPQWIRDFPAKSKYHVDNYISEWDGEERRNGVGSTPPYFPQTQMGSAPPPPLGSGPYPGQNPNKKKSGRCTTCGIYSVDTCRCCKKCPYDCKCPKVPLQAFPDFESQAFGPGWAKAQKIIAELQEREDAKRNGPIGRREEPGEREQQVTRGNMNAMNLPRFETSLQPFPDPIVQPHLKSNIDVMNPLRQFNDDTTGQGQNQYQPQYHQQQQQMMYQNQGYPTMQPPQGYPYYHPMMSPYPAYPPPPMMMAYYTPPPPPPMYMSQPNPMMPMSPTPYPNSYPYPTEYPYSYNYAYQ